MWDMLNVASYKNGQFYITEVDEINKTKESKVNVDMKMYASKTFETMEDLLKFVNEKKYEIISIIPRTYEPSYCDCYRVDLYELVYR